MTEVSPAVVNDGDEVTMTCIVHFGAAKNTLLTSEQVPHLTMTFNNNELTSEARYTDGQPSVSRHSITRVSLSLSVCLSICSYICLCICL